MSKSHGSKSNPDFVALLGGQQMPYRDAAIPVWDYGFTMGITLTERLRSFGGKLPMLDRHLDRLWRSAEALRLADRLDRQQLRHDILTINDANRELIDPASDLGIGVCVTPGPWELRFQKRMNRFPKWECRPF